MHTHTGARTSGPCTWHDTSRTAFWKLLSSSRDKKRYVMVVTTAPMAIMVVQTMYLHIPIRLLSVSTNLRTSTISSRCAVSDKSDDVIPSPSSPSWGSTEDKDSSSLTSRFCFFIIFSWGVPLVIEAVRVLWTKAHSKGDDCEFLFRGKENEKRIRRDRERRRDEKKRIGHSISHSVQNSNPSF